MSLTALKELNCYFKTGGPHEHTTLLLTKIIVMMSVTRMSVTFWHNTHFWSATAMLLVLNLAVICFNFLCLLM